MADDDHKICQAAYGNCPHVTEAADVAVKKVFAILGVDVDVPKEVEQFRENLRFGANLRRAADKGTIVLIGTITAIFATDLWTGLTLYIKKAG